MTAEDRLSELMDAATCALDPPIEAILVAGERLGRARRRRRRIAILAGTAAVVLLAGAGVAAGLHGTDLDHDYGAAGQVTRPSQPAQPEPASSAAAPSPVPTGQVPINATAAVRILKRLGSPTWIFGSYEASAPGSLLRVNIDDGYGLAQIFVAVAPAARSGMDPVDCTPQWLAIKAAGSPAGGAVQPSCHELTEPNGDRVMEQILAPAGSNVVIYRVIADRSDGLAVEIAAQNGDPASTVNEVTRALPPLSPYRWMSIATNRAWQLDVPAALAN